MSTKRLGPTDAVTWLLTRIGSWTVARWDQHLRDEFGDEVAGPAIEAIQYNLDTYGFGIRLESPPPSPPPPVCTGTGHQVSNWMHAMATLPETGPCGICLQVVACDFYGIARVHAYLSPT